MANYIGNMIANSGTLAMGYAEGLLQGIPAEHFARFASPGGQVVHSNHAAFIIGHLGLYGHQMVEELGGPLAADTIPTRFAELFSKTATCDDDRDGSRYPSPTEITDVFFTGYRAAIDALRNTDDELLCGENPSDGPIKKRFPTLGGLHGFYMGGHVMMHLGHLSAFRRMLGLKPA
ncbi:MAG: DinB family protein, partial [Pirellulaceae bacterium]